MAEDKIEIVDRLNACEGETENASWFNTPPPGLMTEAALTIQSLVKALEEIADAADGLSRGTDWNNGTHAKLHGYRQKLLDALPAARAVLSKLRGSK